MSGAAPGSPQEKPDPLDRIVQSISPGRGDDGMASIDRAVVYRLVEIARAARARRAHEHNQPMLLDYRTYEDWAIEDTSLGAAEDAALARLDNHT